MRKLLIQIVLGVFGIGLALLIGVVTLLAFGREEILDRILYNRCVQAEGDWHGTILALNNTYPEPCSSFYWDVYPTGEFYNLISVNSYGLHDNPVSLEKPDGTFRILIMGDSFPQGWQVKLEEGFPYLMEQALNKGQRVEVVNLGIDTYGTDRQLLLYAAFGWRFEADVVLLTFYTGNDIKDNSYWLSSLDVGKPLQRPVFTLDENGALQLHNAPEVEIDPRRFPLSPAWSWLVERVADQTPLPERPLPDVPRVKKQEPYELEYGVDLGLYMPPDEYWSDSWLLTEALLLQFRDLVAQQGSKFGVVVIPDRRAVHASDWDTTVSIFPFMRGYDPYAPGDRIEAFLSEQGLTYLNLTYTLRGWASSNPGERLYYIGDGHFNTNGHIVAAQRIEFWLRESGLIGT
jgi:hypothetical protein